MKNVRITQIASGVVDTGRGSPQVLCALCEDGSVRHYDPNTSSWRKLPSVSDDPIRRKPRGQDND